MRKINKRIRVLLVSTIVVLVLVSPSLLTRWLIQSSFNLEITTQHQLGTMPPNFIYGESSPYQTNATFIFRPYEIYRALWEEGTHYIFLEKAYQVDILYFYDFSQGKIVYYTKLAILQPKAKILDTVTIGQYQTVNSRLEDGVLTIQRKLTIDQVIQALVLFLSFFSGIAIGYYLYLQWIAEEVRHPGFYIY